MYRYSLYKIIFFLFSSYSLLFFLFLCDTNFLDINPKSVVEKEIPIELISPVSNTPVLNLKNNRSDSLTLSIVNTNIKIPIAQGTDNSYYLNHSLTGKEDKVGTPFLDYRNHLDDQKLLIYGHNSKTIDTPFHILEQYTNPSFLREHPSFILRGEGAIYHYQIFSVLVVTNDFQHMKLEMNHEEYKRHLDWFQKNSMYNTLVNVYDNDDILVLQTCYYSPKDSYLLIVSKKVK